MSKYILTKRQFQLLMETGAANAAMDLDIYIQPVHHDTSNGNEDISDTINDIRQKLDELNSMLKNGKKIDFELKNEFYSILDKLDMIYEQSIEKP